MAVEIQEWVTKMSPPYRGGGLFGLGPDAECPIFPVLDFLDTSSTASAPHRCGRPMSAMWGRARCSEMKASRSAVPGAEAAWTLPKAKFVPTWSQTRKGCAGD